MINVINNGVSHDFVDQSNNIQALVDNYDSLYFPSGYYRIDKPIVLKSDLVLIGDNATFVVLGDVAFTGQDIKNVRIKGLKFNQNYDKTSIILKDVKDIHIEDIESSGGCVFINSSENQIRNEHIIISNVKAVNENWINNPTHPDTPFAKGICIEYCSDVRIDNCYIEGQGQGIQIWGGDAEPSRATVPKAKDVMVTNCIVKKCSGGAIWGSMVENMQVNNCLVDYTRDVGIDFEGCYNSMATNCIVKNCRAGNLSVFSLCKNIRLSDIISIEDSNDYKNSIDKPYNTHFALCNSSNNPMEIDVTLDGCQFISSNVSIGEVTFGACRNRIIRNCKFENVVLTYNIGSSGHVNSDISNNRMMFTKPVNGIIAMTAISKNYDGFHNIHGNTIQFNGTDGNCVGIKCLDVNCEGNFLVHDNYIINMKYGEDVSIRCMHEGSKEQYSTVKDNTVNTRIVTKGAVHLQKTNNISIGGTAF